MKNTNLLRSFLIIALAATLQTAPAPVAAAPVWDEELAMAVEVPLDRQRPELGLGTIYLQLGAPFDPAKPVVVVIADGQQFYVRRGAMAKLQQEIFGPSFNVAGIFGRGSGEAFLTAAAADPAAPDWLKAWGIFESSEWVEDIEACRLALLGRSGRFSLYGQSGGAFLVHQYLAAHGRNVDRAITPTAVNPFLLGELGLLPDRFWQETGAFDQRLHGLLAEALRRFPADRARVAMTLQRQSFFVPAAELPVARAELIRALARGDGETFSKARLDYQVDPVSDFFASAAGLPVRVRLFEFVAPAGWLDRLDPEAFYPDLENQRNFAAPLLELWRKGAIKAPSWDKANLHTLGVEVLVLAGVRDHTVDYRTSIALAALYPRGQLLLFDDDHRFHGLTEDGTLHPLIRAFLAGGARSPAFAQSLASASPRRYRE